MKMMLFARRNTKEILREPLNLCFGLGFPLILLVLLTVVNSAIPQEANNTLFAIANLAPGLAMFGTAFMALFAGMLLSKDRTSSFLMRLFTSPMRAVDFLLGYTAPMLLMTAAQVTITLAASLIVGLKLTAGLLLVIPVTMLTALLFIGLGLLCGSIFSDKAVGGICGALFTNIAGWLSGVFIPLELIGGGFKAFCEALPFWQSVEAIKEALNGNFMRMLPHLGISLAYAVAVFAVAVVVFQHKMRSDK
jgi:ABC-2 type transport system permease protein